MNRENLLQAHLGKQKPAKNQLPALYQCKNTKHQHILLKIIEKVKEGEKWRSESLPQPVCKILTYPQPLPVKEYEQRQEPFYYQV